jgi:hypothetical protein
VECILPKYLGQCYWKFFTWQYIRYSSISPYTNSCITVMCIYAKKLCSYYVGFEVLTVAVIHSFIVKFHRSNRGYSYENENCHLLGYSAVYSVYEPTFRRNVSSPSSGSKISPEASKSRWLHGTVSHNFHFYVHISLKISLCFSCMRPLGSVIYITVCRNI